MVLEPQDLEPLCEEINPLFVTLEGVLPVCYRSYVALELTRLHLIAFYVNEVALVSWLSSFNTR